MSSVNQDNLHTWEKIADFWDDKIGHGNTFSRAIVFPVAERMLKLSEQDHVLEIGCGSGLFANGVLSRSRRVVATDACERFLAIAKQRYGQVSNVQFRRLDATEPEDFRAFEENTFDKAVCNMAIMDIPSLEALFEGLRTILRNDGLFVFTIPHPCFRTNNARYTVERAMDGDELRVARSVKVERYLTQMQWKQIGIIGQPEAHYMFHRSITEILAKAFQNGFLVKDFQEVGDPSKFDKKNPFALQNFPETPAIMAVSLVLQKAERTQPA